MSAKKHTRRGFLRTVAVLRPRAAQSGRAVGCAALTVLLAWAVAKDAYATATVPDAVPTRRAIEAMWRELGSDDGNSADKAAAGLAGAGEAALAVFRDKLRNAEADRALTDKLLAQLDSGEFTVRRKAQDDLLAQGSAAAPALRRAVGDARRSAEARSACTMLLKKVAESEARRTARMVRVLARIRSDSARAMLHVLAERPSRDRTGLLARAALARLSAAALFGRVRDERGRPVAGAEVLLFYHRSSWAFENEVVETVRTDRAGTFRFTRPLAFKHLNGSIYTDHYFLITRHPDRAPAWQLVLSGQENPPRELVVTAPAEQAFLVTDGDGTPVPGARVWLRTAGDRADTNPEFRTYLHVPQDIEVLGAAADSAGRVKLRNLPATSLSLNCSRDGYADTLVRLDRPSAKERAVKMALAGPVSGVVLDPSGRGVAGAVLRYKAHWGLHHFWLTRTDKNGRYRVPDLVPAGGSWTANGGNGSYLVQLVDPRFTMIQRRIQVRAGKETQVDIDAVPGTLIQGRVLEPGTNRPVPGARVQADTPSGRLNAHADDAGEFTWRSVRGVGEASFVSPPAGTYVDSSSRRQHVLAIQGRRVGLDIYAPSAVRPLVDVKGKAVLANGSPGASAVVWPAMNPRFERHNGNALSEAVAGDDGSFEVKDVPSGQDLAFYVVTRDRRWAGTSALAVGDGDASLTVRLLPTVSIDAMVRDNAGKVWPNHKLEVCPVVGGRKLSFAGRTVTTDGEGRIRLHGILPGVEYSIADAVYPPKDGSMGSRTGFQAVVLVLAPTGGGKASDAVPQPPAIRGPARGD